MAHKSLGDVTVADIAGAGGVPPEEADRILTELRLILSTAGGPGPDAWKAISRRLLRPELPFALHRLMYYGCYHEFPSAAPPAWFPEPEHASSTNIAHVLAKYGNEFLGLQYKDPITSFPDFQKFSVSRPEDYWRMVFNEMKITFNTDPNCILQEDPSYPGGQWLPGATFNAASGCIDVMVGSDMDNVAVISRDEDDSANINHLTFRELRSQVCLVANALDTLGLEAGCSIAIDMPMNVTSVFIYLGIVLAGYVVVSIADSFAPDAISSRLRISNAKAIFTQDYIYRDGKELPLYSRVVEAGAPLAIVVSGRSSSSINGLREDDLYWHDFVGRVHHHKSASYTAKVQPIEAFTNILFSSGTTGEPKAIPWTHATPLKAAADAWAHLDIQRGDVVAWPTNLGWMMGPWLVYASLLNGASMALYNGSPSGSGFAKFVQDAKVTMLGVIPSLVRSWKNSNCTAGFDWSAIRCFGSTGEASNVDDYLWLMGRAHYKPVIEYCGGTEIGGAFVTGSLLQPQSLSTFSTAAMGCKLFILDNLGNPLPEDAAGIGELALDPTMFGSSSTLLNADHFDVYFKGMPSYNRKPLRRHGDEFERTKEGYYRAHGRADDTMNLGGIKVSSIEIERICNRVNESVLEIAALGVPPGGGGPEQLFVAAVLKDCAKPDLIELKKEFNAALRKLNPLFKVSAVVVVPSLPRTASNKVMRRVLRKELVEAQQQRAKF